MNRKMVFVFSLFFVVLAGMVIAPTTFAKNNKNRKGRTGGALFVMTNSANGNQVVMFDREANGDLNFVGNFSTEGLGSGPAPTAQIFNLASGGVLPLVSAQFDGLGSSNSLILSHNNRCLLAVNGGSNTITSFLVLSDGLELVSQLDSGGEFPVSLTVHEHLLYVLNAADVDDGMIVGALAGFEISGDCELTPLAGSVVNLGGLWEGAFPVPAPAEVLTTVAQASFTPDGKRLILSIKGLEGAAINPDGSLAALPNGRMVVFPVMGSGLLGTPVVNDSLFDFLAGTGGPFSFVFAPANNGKDRTTIVAVHANSGTVASYALHHDNTLSLIGSPLAIASFAPCWIDANKHFVYTASFGAPSGVREILGEGAGLPDLNGLLTGFRLRGNGTLKPLKVRGASVAVEYPDPSALLGTPATGNHGIDIRIIESYLYFLQPRTGMIGRLTIRPNGVLTDLQTFSGGALTPGLEPFPGLNPGINDFTERCFITDAAPECDLGSVQGITGF